MAEESSPTSQIVEKGTMMKGLATISAILILCGATLAAGPVEVTLNGGLSAVSLDEINAVITQFNTLIVLLNETFEALPDVEGSVETIGRIGSGIALQVGERFLLTERLALGGTLDVFHTSASTAGTYTSSETSDISIALTCTDVGLVIGGRYDFLNAGLILSADIGIGYYYGTFRQAITFQVPPEFPDTIAGLPPEGAARYSGFAPALEAGLGLCFPLADWFKIGSNVSYRFLTFTEMTDGQGNSLDLDGNGTPERIDLGGITVELAFVILIDLSPDGGKE